jgi:Family of unknown function (DUF5985)
MMPAIYVLTCLTTLLCATLLLRGYARTRRRLLLWSGLCFVGLTLTHLIMIVDLLVLPKTDLFTFRLGSTAVAMCLLLYGLVWESE